MHGFGAGLRWVSSYRTSNNYKDIGDKRATSNNEERRDKANSATTKTGQQRQAQNHNNKEGGQTQNRNLKTGGQDNKEGGHARGQPQNQQQKTGTSTKPEFRAERAQKNPLQSSGRHLDIVSTAWADLPKPNIPLRSGSQSTHFNRSKA